MNRTGKLDYTFALRRYCRLAITVYDTETKERVAHCTTRIEEGKMYEAERRLLHTINKTLGTNF